MLQYSLLLLLPFYVFHLFAQNTSGITGKPDTSYNTYSAWIHDLKNFPGISIVPELKSTSVTEKKNIPYCTTGNRKLRLDVFAPSAKQEINHVAIIIIHGGGWRSGSRAQHYPLAQQLTSMGYTCFTPEYRLSTEALFPAAVYDIKSAIRYVRSNAHAYNVDTNKIVALGFSAGGELAAFMGTTGNMPLFEGTNCTTNATSNVNAVVDIDGILSFVHPDGNEGDDSKNISAGTHWFGYAKATQPYLWEAASPLSYVSASTPPTLFINSAVSRMHAGREDYIAVLNRYRIYSEVHEFENSPHSFILYSPWFKPSVSFIENFLQKVFNQ